MAATAVRIPWRGDSIDVTGSRVKRSRLEYPKPGQKQIASNRLSAVDQAEYRGSRRHHSSPVRPACALLRGPQFGGSDGGAGGRLRVESEQLDQEFIIIRHLFLQLGTRL